MKTKSILEVREKLWLYLVTLGISLCILGTLSTDVEATDNQPPQFSPSPIPDQYATVGVDFNSEIITITDVDGPQLLTLALPYLPSGAYTTVVDSSLPNFLAYRIVWPAEQLIPGDYTIILQARDTIAPPVQESITIHVNHAPILDLIGDRQGVEGEEFVIPLIRATDLDRDVMTMPRPLNLPAGAQFNELMSVGGEIQYEVRWPNPEKGVYEDIRFEVLDGAGGIDYEDIAITINAAGANWPVRYDGEHTNSTAVADLDGDGNLEVVGVVGSGAVCLDISGNEVWSYQETSTNPYFSAVYSSPALADLDGDSNLEVLFGLVRYVNTEIKGAFYCLDTDGQKIWSFYTEEYVSSSPVVADLDGDGNPEILIGADGLRCLNKNGQQLWRYNDSTIIGSSPAVADLDGDGNLEVVISGDNLFCIDKDGQLIWDYPITDSLLSCPTIGDLDGDGNPEILIKSRDDDLYCLDKDGQLVWIYYAGGMAERSSGPAIADFDGDGNKEVVFASYSTLYLLDKDGQFIWDYDIGRGYGSPVVADLDGDGNLEIMIGSGELPYGFNRNFYCIDKDGNLLWSREPNGAVGTAAAIADLDGDGNLEIIFTTILAPGGPSYGYINCLDKDGNDFVPSATPGSIKPMPWPMYRHDPQHTGYYASPLVLDPIGDKSVDENTPLIFTVNATDPDGDTLIYSASNLPTGANFDPETHTFSWTPTYHQAGIYPNVHFEVGDGLYSDSEDITITVNNVILIPTAYIDSIAPNPAQEGQVVTLTGHGEDRDGEVIGYNWRSSIDGDLGSDSTIMISTLSVGMHTIFFKVKDNDDAWSEEVSQDLIIEEAEKGVIYGRVFGERWRWWRRSRIPPEGAIVRIRGRWTGTQKFAETDRYGKYRIENLPQDLYKIRAIKRGYRLRTEWRFLRRNRRIRVNFYLYKKWFWRWMR